VDASGDAAPTAVVPQAGASRSCTARGRPGDPAARRHAHPASAGPRRTARRSRADRGDRLRRGTLLCSARRSPQRRSERPRLRGRGRAARRRREGSPRDRPRPSPPLPASSVTRLEARARASLAQPISNSRSLSKHFSQRSDFRSAPQSSSAASRPAVSRRTRSAPLRRANETSRTTR